MASPAGIATLLLLSICLNQCCNARLVRMPTTVLSYHNGRVLTDASRPSVSIIWYGAFTESQKSPIRDFLSSLSVGDSDDETMQQPSVRSWWEILEMYRDGTGAPVAGSWKLGEEHVDASCSKGKKLSLSDIETLVLSYNSLHESDTEDFRTMYLVLTADDILVESFCMNSCASHFSMQASSQAVSELENGQELLYAWVGNSASQCPGKCAWPFAQAEYGPRVLPMIPPNGDVGVDGMIINVAAILAGTATNPYNNGFFQGDAGVPLEAATACAGNFGAGAFPGYAGRVLVNDLTGAGYNVHGVNDRKFLLPALWDPSTMSCALPSTSAVQ